MHTANQDDFQHGLVVYRASRLEALLDPLLQLLDSAPPADALAPQTVIAAHPGMRHWLAGALARKRGPGGIVANLEIRLPSDWLDTLARDVLGEAAVALAPYRRERLRWRIHDKLDGIDDPQLRRYLGGGDTARRRYRLADRLARLYAQYMVYRPDWLAAWERGRDEVPEPTFLAPLWRALRAAIDRPHRAEVLGALLQALDRAPPARLPREPLHVFGLSHLAPAELAVFAAVARHRLVVFHVPDPCREYWAGLRSTRTQMQALAARLDAGDSAEADFVEDAGHPLLADWGRMGQHFMLALAGLSGVRVDVRHWQDEDRAAPPPVALLHQLQESIRRLGVSLLAPVRGEAGLRDRSLRVHLCHTRLRELEVLRDALLAELAARPDLEPSDIVVMAPDIAAYLPLLPAVFGEPGRHHGPLPYHLADVAGARAHPLFDAFDRLLDTPGSRLATPQVLDLLQAPAIALALGLDDDDVERLGQWLGEARVAWALDGDWRAGFGVPAIAEHSFAWGMDRLLAGYVMGGGDEAFALPDGALWPVPGASGPQAAALGALDRLLRELAALHRDAATPRRASAWSARLAQLLDALFRVAPDDHAGREALGLLRRFIHATAAETRDAGLDPELDFAVVREVLRERLAAASERQRFLLGGVTFCGMVPQRAIPFRVIAVLGLDDGEFPRGASDQGLDLTLRHRRLGDRDVRSDDRYLFLETVMAARDVLHLSYLGEGVRDGRPRHPAAPLAELLALLDTQAGVSDAEADGAAAARTEGRAAAVSRPWRVRHPLQPFDARYFDGSDPRLFSYRAELAAMVAAPAAPAGTDADAAASDGNAAAALRDVLAWYRDPAKQVLRQGLDVRLDALEEDRLRESEPLEAKFEALDRVGRRLVLGALEGDQSLPADPPDWLRLTGLLPPGRPGVAAWEHERARAAAMLERARGLPLLLHRLPPRLPVAVQEDVGGLRLEGELARAYERAGARWVFDVFPGSKEAQLGFRERVPLFAEWALLRRLTPPSMPVRIALLVPEGETPWQARINAWDESYVAADAATRATMRDDLARRLAGLLELWRRARQRPPLWYFPRTSWSVAEDLQRGREPRPLAAWQGHGGDGRGERDHAPGYARLLAGDARFEPGRPEYGALVDVAGRLAALIDLERPA